MAEVVQTVFARLAHMAADPRSDAQLSIAGKGGDLCPPRTAAEHSGFGCALPRCDDELKARMDAEGEETVGRRAKELVDFQEAVQESAA